MTHASNNAATLRGRAAGFTLIEILIVISIIGVLMAIAIPNYANARATAVSRASQQHGQAVLLSLNSFLAARPGLTAAAMMSAQGWRSGSTSPGGLSGSSCEFTSSLTGGSSSPRVSSAAGGMGWNAPSDPRIKCNVSADTTTPDPSDFRVVSWSTNKTDITYVNGKKVP